MQLRKAVDQLYLHDPDFAAGAASFVRSVGGSRAAQAVSSWNDLKTALNAYTGVKFLVFDTHGSPGTVCLADGSNVTGVDFLVLASSPQLLRQDAHVLFYGCNVGEGVAGDTFLRDAGRHLLRGRGGVIGASTVVNVTFQLGSLSSEVFMNPLAPGAARLKVRRYDRSGAEIGAQAVDRWGRVR